MTQHEGPRPGARRRRWLGALVAVFLRLLGATWRVRVDGVDPFASGAPFVGAIWHRGMLVAAWVWRDRGLAIPVSRSRDGDRIDAVLARLGFAESPRGSSSRGGSAVLRALIRRVRAGGRVAFLVDGPRGPAGVAKPGALALARVTGAPIIPGGVAARPAKAFGSWDRTILPLPFARVRCRYGPPLVVPKDADADELEALRERLDLELERLQSELEADLGGAGDAPDRCGS